MKLNLDSSNIIILESLDNVSYGNMDLYTENIISGETEIALIINRCTVKITQRKQQDTIGKLVSMWSRYFGS